MTSSRRKEFGDSSVLRVEFGSPFQATGRLNVEAALDHIEQSVGRVCVSLCLRFWRIIFAVIKRLWICTPIDRHLAFWLTLTLFRSTVECEGGVGIIGGSSLPRDEVVGATSRGVQALVARCWRDAGTMADTRRARPPTDGLRPCQAATNTRTTARFAFPRLRLPPPFIVLLLVVATVPRTGMYRPTRSKSSALVYRRNISAFFVAYVS